MFAWRVLVALILFVLIRIRYYVPLRFIFVLCCFVVCALIYFKRIVVVSFGLILSIVLMFECVCFVGGDCVRLFLCLFILVVL